MLWITVQPFRERPGCFAAMSTNKTLGEYRVRTDFNASNSTTVSELKNAFAHLIDSVASLPEKEGEEGEARRLKALANTRLEEAAMWAVKAATL